MNTPALHHHWLDHGVLFAVPCACDANSDTTFGTQEMKLHG